MVLVTISILLVVVAEVSSRSMREFRVLKARSASAQAYFAAEAGFSRVRAQISWRDDGSLGLPYLDPAREANGEWTTVEEDFKDKNGAGSQVVGHYRVSVRRPDPAKQEWLVISKGWDAARNAQQVVSGKITLLTVDGRSITIESPKTTEKINKLAVVFD